MRKKGIPNKEDLLKTEMEIQQQIDQWMKGRKENKKNQAEECQVPQDEKKATS